MDDIERLVKAYLDNLYYNDVDENEAGMSEDDPLKRLGGVSPVQVKAVMEEFLQYTAENFGH